MAWRASVSKNLQELRVHLCQKGPDSQGARDFIHSSYSELKKANPKFPFLVRECSGVKPKLIARYDFGVEHSVPLTGLDANGVSKALEELVQKGESMPRSTESEGSL
ncbi:hypothetical protein WJX84_000885 [Apatococcus fuscideae]|uniref:Ribosomal protein/NADH dehydrogenase domain-containing protein n=1 Tax=Apatococcus fuscideae TaxID=2026836 RepID=A0AAW1T273_9CHLO